MFPEIVHEGRFRNPSTGRGPLVTYLTGTYFSNKSDRKALQYPPCNTGQYHMHFNGTDGFQYFFPGSFVFHTLQGCRLPFPLVIAYFGHVL